MNRAKGVRMAGVRKRGEAIRQYILANVQQHSTHIAALTSEEFSISRQAVNKHIKRLVDQGLIAASGSRRHRTYKLASILRWESDYEITSTIAEDVVWDIDISNKISDLPSNAKDIWYYGFTEILNNAIDHSSGQKVWIGIDRTAIDTSIYIVDDGVGIFKKIKTELNLEDERQAVLELAKGKVTTDPENHSGQGIFFTSRMLDSFAIMSEDIVFSHQVGNEDWIANKKDIAGIESLPSTEGTLVVMSLANNTARTDKQVFDEFSADIEDGYGFIKTNVPVRLAQYGSEKLISRSQGKRLVAGLDKFKTIILDFADVEAIGQAFADEVFRVFANKHPEIEIRSLNRSLEVEKMILRAASENRDLG